jgi:uncharacterized protein YlaN (UPF0358 family)
LLWLYCHVLEYEEFESTIHTSHDYLFGIIVIACVKKEEQKVRFQEEMLVLKPCPQYQTCYSIGMFGCFLVKIADFIVYQGVEKRKPKNVVVSTSAFGRFLICREIDTLYQKRFHDMDHHNHCYNYYVI